MIAFASGLPLLKIGNQAIAEYSPQWLEDTIRRAANHAGHESWWFAQDIVRSVFIYLRERFHASVISIEELFEKVRRTLEMLGFHDIAEQLSDTPPPWLISLPQIVSEASGGYELRFFQLLRLRMEEALKAGATQIHFVGLRPAAKTLCGASKWRMDCDQICEEVKLIAERQLSENNRVELHIS